VNEDEYEVSHCFRYATISQHVAQGYGKRYQRCPIGRVG